MCCCFLFKLCLTPLGLSRSPRTLVAAHGTVQFSDQGSEPGAPCTEVLGLSRWTTREASQPCVFFMSIFWMIFVIEAHCNFFSALPVPPSPAHRTWGVRDVGRRSTCPHRPHPLPPPFGPQSIDSWLVSGGAHFNILVTLQGPWQPRRGPLLFLGAIPHGAFLASLNTPDRFRLRAFALTVPHS